MNIYKENTQSHIYLEVLNYVRMNIERDPHTVWIDRHNKALHGFLLMPGFPDLQNESYLATLLPSEFMDLPGYSRRSDTNHI